MKGVLIQTVFILLHFIWGTTAVISASGNVLCGRTMIRKSKVIGGTDANEGEFPWLVSIVFGGRGFDTVHLCGGALIHERFVLTAAHCMLHKVLKYVSIVAGEYDVRGRSAHEQIMNVKRVHSHKDFGKGYLNDIALVELAEPVTWSTYVRPICLPDATIDAGDNSLDDQMVKVAGWGYTDESANGGAKAEVLQKALLPIVSQSICQSWFDAQTQKAAGDPQHLLISPKSHLCAGYDTGVKDSCSGDSGGPLMKIDKSGREVVVGVVSAGIGCGRAKMPGIYTRIVSYMPWIQSILTSQGIRMA